MKKLVCGVGTNDANYVVQIKTENGYVLGKRKRKIVWRCPFYNIWVQMLVRGYDEKFKLKRPTYKDVTVCEEWWLFSTFKSWMGLQDWEGKQLDKDLLIPGNKVYSPNTCVFVSGQVNNFLTDSEAARGDYKIGVSLQKDCGKFRATCKNPFDKTDSYIGLFNTEESAYLAWLGKKREYAKCLSMLQTDKRVAEALVSYYDNYKEKS